MKVSVSSTAWRELRKLQANTGLVILTAIIALGDDPHPAASKRLVGQAAYRLRVGDFRVIYHIDGDQLLIDEIGDRKEIYG